MLDNKALGGDWGGYGVQDGKAILDMLQGNKIKILWAQKGIAIEVTTKSGQTGVYNLRHEDAKAF